MNGQTRRRAFLGGIAATAVGGTSLLLNRARSRPPGRWLRPADPVAESPTFAAVEGVVDDGRMHVTVAMRARRDSGRRIVLFADADDPVTASIPALRSFWRFEAETAGRPPGEYTLRVGDETLPVELVADLPPHGDARVELTPRVTWRSDHVAHATGHSTGDGGGRIQVAFRRRTRDGSPDAVAFRDPEGRIIGRREVPPDVVELGFDGDPLTVFDDDGDLLGLRDDREVDAVPMFYH